MAKKEEKQEEKKTVPVKKVVEEPQRESRSKLLFLLFIYLFACGLVFSIYPDLYYKNAQIDTFTLPFDSQSNIWAHLFGVMMISSSIAVFFIWYFSMSILYMPLMFSRCVIVGGFYAVMMKQHMDQKNIVLFVGFEAFVLFLGIPTFMFGQKKKYITSFGAPSFIFNFLNLMVNIGFGIGIIMSQGRIQEEFFDQWDGMTSSFGPIVGVYYLSLGSLWFFAMIRKCGLYLVPIALITRIIENTIWCGFLISEIVRPTNFIIGVLVLNIAFCFLSILNINEDPDAQKKYEDIKKSQ